MIDSNLSQGVIKMLKYLARNEDRAIQYTTISQMFKLLEIFTSQK